MPIPAEYRAEHDRVKEMKGRRERTTQLIVYALVEGDIDRALRLTEQWKEEDAKCHELFRAEVEAMQRYKVIKAARKLGLVVITPEEDK